AAHARRAVAAGDFDLDDAARFGELSRRDAIERPDIDADARQAALHFFSRDALLPLRHTRKAVARSAALRRRGFDEIYAARRVCVIDHTLAADQCQPINRVACLTEAAEQPR